MSVGKYPLGLCRHLVAALDCALTDVREIMEEELPQEDMTNMEILSEVLCNSMALITNMVSSEINEDEFMAEEISMDFDSMHEKFDDNEMITDILDQSI